MRIIALPDAPPDHCLGRDCGRLVEAGAGLCRECRDRTPILIAAFPTDPPMAHLSSAAIE
jgi:hypothetical protein